MTSACKGLLVQAGVVRCVCRTLSQDRENEDNWVGGRNYRRCSGGERILHSGDLSLLIS